MIEAKGTREEWEKFAEKVGHIYQVNTGMKIKEAIIIAVRNDGYITKPEWEQAYNDLLDRGSMMNPHTFRLNLDRMHDRIVELEKKLEKGK